VPTGTIVADIDGDGLPSLLRCLLGASPAGTIFKRLLIAAGFGYTKVLRVLVFLVVLGLVLGFLVLLFELFRVVLVLVLGFRVLVFDGFRGMLELTFFFKYK
jgi:hypothetical protein